MNECDQLFSSREIIRNALNRYKYSVELHENDLELPTTFSKNQLHVISIQTPYHHASEDKRSSLSLYLDIVTKMKMNEHDYRHR